MDNALRSEYKGFFFNLHIYLFVYLCVWVCLQACTGRGLLVGACTMTQSGTRV